MVVMSLSRTQRKLIYIEDFREELERLNKELTAYKEVNKILIKEIEEYRKGHRQLIDELHKLKGNT